MNRKSSGRNRPIACDSRFDTFAEAVTHPIAVICTLMSLFAHTQRRTCEMGKCTRLHCDVNCVLTRDRSSHVRCSGRQTQTAREIPTNWVWKKKTNFCVMRVRVKKFQKCRRRANFSEFITKIYSNSIQFWHRKKEIRTNNRMTNLEMKMNRIACVPRGTSYRFQTNAFAL